jgi:molybdopterin-guanine dinucleotide biosynthesis protein A
VNDYSNITLAVLAGGQGARMGKAKAEIKVDGKPILECLLAEYRWPGPTMLVTAPGREHPSGYELFHTEVVDPVAGEGPLRGLLTALENVTTPLLAVTTVDMPGVSRLQLSWLVSELEHRPKTLGVMCRHAKQIEPFPSIFRAQAIDTVRARLETGRTSVYGLSDQLGFEIADAPADWSDSVWMNLNSPADLLTFLNRRV